MDDEHVFGLEEWTTSLITQALPDIARSLAVLPDRGLAPADVWIRVRSGASGPLVEVYDRRSVANEVAARGTDIPPDDLLAAIAAEVPAGHVRTIVSDSAGAWASLDVEVELPARASAKITAHRAWMEQAVACGAVAQAATQARVASLGLSDVVGVLTPDASGSVAMVVCVRSEVVAQARVAELPREVVAKLASDVPPGSLRMFCMEDGFHTVADAAVPLDGPAAQSEVIS